MTAPKYAPVRPNTDEDLVADHQDGSTSSHGSGETARFTPDTDSDMEDEDELDMREGGQNFKMKRLAPESSKGLNTLDDIGEDEEDMEHIHLRSRRRASTQSFELYTPDEEKAVVRQFDKRLVLFMALLYMLSFLDRSNIGNARIAGLEQDLRLTDAQFDWLLTAFYITYIVFEWMTLMYFPQPFKYP